MVKIDLEDNLADPFTKTLPEMAFNKHLLKIRLRDMIRKLYSKWKIVRNMPLKSDVIIIFRILIKEIIFSEFCYFFILS